MVHCMLEYESQSGGHVYKILAGGGEKVQDWHFLSYTMCETCEHKIYNFVVDSIKSCLILSNVIWGLECHFVVHLFIVSVTIVCIVLVSVRPLISDSCSCIWSDFDLFTLNLISNPEIKIVPLRIFRLCSDL